MSYFDSNITEIRESEKVKDVMFQMFEATTAKQVDAVKDTYLPLFGKHKILYREAMRAKKRIARIEKEKMKSYNVN